MTLPKVDMERWKVAEVRVYTIPRGSLDELAVVLQTEDVGRRGSAEVCRRIVVPSRLTLAQERDELKAWIRKEILATLEHELDECLYVDGERVCKDPHPELRGQ